jgi:hypothetical protein
MSVMSVVCCEVEVLSFVQRSSTELSVSEFELETSTVRRARPTGAIEPREKIICSVLNFLMAV